ncbi:MAG: AgmX/PglI C-terminal domain-containing protein [Deltaproteobacteria bacterium]|jgi:hypothetical protein|nr:AgmX/PglI C-terminal domain-containing protein [Deltaproteobacteria bacterium]
MGKEPQPAPRTPSLWLVAGFLAVVFGGCGGAGASAKATADIPAGAYLAVPPYRAKGACPPGPDGKPARLQSSGPPGSLERDHIRARIAGIKTLVRRCYEAAQWRAPVRPGRLTTHFRVAPDGQVDAACILDSALLEDELEACVLATIRGLRFDPPKGGGSVTVIYPYIVTKRPSPE